jgi:hypothetical protein
MEQHVKPNMFRWDQQWSHQPRYKCHHQSITRCQPTNKKIKRKVVKRHEFAHTKFMMEATAFGMASWDVVCSSPSEQWRRWMPTKFKGWPQMQWIKLKSNEWGKPNLVCNVKEKTLKAKWKYGLIKRTKSHALAPSPHRISNVRNANQKPCQKWC